MRVTVLCENTIGTPMPKWLIGEHGLSFLIEDKQIKNEFTIASVRSAFNF